MDLFEASKEQVPEVMPVKHTELSKVLCMHAPICNAAKVSNIKQTDYDLFDHLEEKIHTIQTMHSCDDCSVVFHNVHDLQNHVERWCPERPAPKRPFPDEDIYPDKRMKYDSEESNDYAQYLDQEDEVFKKLAKIARNENENEWEDKVENTKS
jgi:hypothetical protein